MAESNTTATVKTYNCKEVYITLGSHIVTGYAEDNFVSFEPAGDGVTAIYGCDGEVSRAVDPNDAYSVKLVIQQMSSTNAYLQNQYDLDRKDGSGLFSISINDLRGNKLFNASACWVIKPSARTYGKTVNNREWNLYAVNVTVDEDTSESKSTT